jgi:hypothetical protein
MNRIVATVSKALASVAVLGAFAVVSLPDAASAQEVVVAPPAEYIATAEPVYYEGHPAYYYNNHWYYRNGAAWASYHDEPAYLRDWRGRPGWGARYHYGAGARAGFRGRR